MQGAEAVRPKESIIRGHRFAACTAAAAALVSFALPTSTASADTYYQTYFNVASGAIYTTGYITWYNRSVKIEGSDRAEAGECRETDGYTLTSSNVVLDDFGGALNCAPTSGPQNLAFSFSVQANVPGGAAYVRICLTDGTNGPCQRYERP